MVSYFPGFKETCKVTIAAPIPKVSSNGKGPMDRKGLFLKHDYAAMFAPLGHSAKFWENDLGSGDHRESKLALLIHFIIWRSWARFLQGLRFIKFWKGHRSIPERALLDCLHCRLHSSTCFPLLPRFWGHPHWPDMQWEICWSQVKFSMVHTTLPDMASMILVVKRSLCKISPLSRTRQWQINYAAASPLVPALGSLWSSIVSVCSKGDTSQQ